MVRNRILIVDDDEDVVDLAKGMIDRRHDVVGATSVPQALELLAEGGFWLLITDIRMPGQNGFQLIQQAKAMIPSLAVVVLSAYYDEEEPIAQEIVRRYADLALTKPLQARVLNEVIDGLC